MPLMAQNVCSTPTYPKMKQLQYLSIQGKSAPAYWFRNYDSQNFRSFIESVTLSQALLVSSIYRTDLFYYAESGQHLESILKAWHAVKRIAQKEHAIDKFIRADNRAETLEMYFDTLFHLMHQPAHLARYKERFRETVQLEPQNIILQDLMACDLHLSEMYKKESLSHVRLNDKPICEATFLPCKHFSLIADKGIAEMIYN